MSHSGEKAKEPMPLTWLYRYVSLEDRAEMMAIILAQAEAGHNVRLGIRPPPGCVQVHGDEPGIFAAQAARPAIGWGGNLLVASPDPRRRR